MPLSANDFTRVYKFTGRVAHIVANEGGVTPDDSHSLCGEIPSLNTGWYGTGTQEEQDKAAMLPLCRFCVDANEYFDLG